MNSTLSAGNSHERSLDMKTGKKNERLIRAERFGVLYEFTF